MILVVKCECASSYMYIHVSVTFLVDMIAVDRKFSLSF